MLRQIPMVTSTTRRVTDYEARIPVFDLSPIPSRGSPHAQNGHERLLQPLPVHMNSFRVDMLSLGGGFLVDVFVGGWLYSIFLILLIPTCLKQAILF